MRYDFLVHLAAFVACFLLLEAALFSGYFARTRAYASIATGNSRLTSAYSMWDETFRTHAAIVWLVSAVGTYFLIFAR